MINRLKIIALSVVITAFFHSNLLADTIVLEGGMASALQVTQERTFSVPAGGLKKLSFRFANPAGFRNGPIVQEISSRSLVFDPKPESVTTEKDSFGNTFTVVVWTNLNRNPVVKESFMAALKIILTEIKSSAPFPLPPGAVPEDVKRFLQPAPMVQSDAAEITGLSKTLTKGALSAQDAATSIMNWVVDNIRYRTPIPAYDAATTLSTKEGNCQNFSHLSIALLRAAGIPARIAGGISLGKSWKAPLKNGSLLQTIGQGGHAWMEVWYPDLGWAPYDAQQSHLFVGPRHIKQTVGLDSNDINDSWRASPALPAFKEEIAAEYLNEEIRLSLKETVSSPESYILTSSLRPAAAPLPPPIKPQEPEMVPFDKEVEFGNITFPQLMDFYISIKSDVGVKTFDKETAEYVTGTETFAQAFTLSRPLRLSTISLAMHKFGGRLGSLWIDVVKDGGGRPGTDGIRSLPLNLDTVSFHQGYKWFDFIFSYPGEDAPLLTPGRYWIILRKSKDAIVTWFYIPGNSYGLQDDARSTAAGIDWSNILNLDFNFKVRGRFMKN